MLRCIKRFTLGHAENWVKVYNVVPFGIFCPFNRQRKDGRTEGSMNRQTDRQMYIRLFRASAIKSKNCLGLKI